MAGSIACTTGCSMISCRLLERSPTITYHRQLELDMANPWQVPSTTSKALEPRNLPQVTLPEHRGELGQVQGLQHGLLSDATWNMAWHNSVDDGGS